MILTEIVKLQITLKKKERKKLEKIQAMQTNTGSRTQYIIRGIFKIYILLT
jgi:hypothetical protein